MRLVNITKLMICAQYRLFFSLDVYRHLDGTYYIIICFY